MANRRGREVDVRPFNPRGETIGPLAQVPRSTGAEDQSLADATGRLADTLGKYADEAAVLEGKAAGAEAGNDPAFRPTGSMTLRGRAYDEAATQSYLDNLEATLRNRIQETYEQHKGDPAALKGAFETLHQDMTDADVFPQIQGKFNKQFATWSNAYLNHARSSAESRANDGLRADLLANLAKVDTSTTRAIATLDPNDPATEEIINESVRRKADLYTRAAGAGAITQTVAEQRRQEDRNRTYGMLVMARAGRLSSPAELEDFQRKFAEDFSAGKYEGKLDAAGYEATVADLTKQRTSMLTAARSSHGALERDLKSFVEREASGLNPSAEEWAALSGAASRVPGGDALLTIAQAKRTLAQKLNSVSIDDGDAIMQQMRERMRAEGGANPHQAALVQFGDEHLAKLRQKLSSDMLGTAFQRGTISAITPLDFEAFAGENPGQAAAAFAGQVRGRVAQAHAVGQSLDRAPQFFRPEEKVRIREIVSNGGDRALNLAQSIVEGAGADAPRMLAELGGDAPLIAQVGNILANGGSLQAARDAFLAGKMKADKLKVGTTNTVLFDSEVRDAFGAAFLMQPEDRSRVIAAARAISETRLTIAGLDAKDPGSREIYKRALQEAMGATFPGGVQYGGAADYKPGSWWWQSTKVVVPPSVRADSFRDVIAAVTDGDLATLPVPPEAPGERVVLARDLRQAVPVAVRGGYRFAMGDPNSDDPRWIRGVDGAPFVLPLDRLMPELRKRVPGAFIGAR